MVKKILVVEDELSGREVLVSFLEDAGYEVVSVKNYNQSMDAFKKHSFDVLVLDINLKEQYTGVDILIRAQEVVPNIKAIMLTGVSDDTGLKQKAKKLGARKIIEKPTSMIKVLEEVNKLFDGR